MRLPETTSAAPYAADGNTAGGAFSGVGKIGHRTTRR
jgi:hypothetical protein